MNESIGTYRAERYFPNQDQMKKSIILSSSQFLFSFQVQAKINDRSLNRIVQEFIEESNHEHFSIELIFALSQLEMFTT